MTLSRQAAGAAPSRVGAPFRFPARLLPLAVLAIVLGPTGVACDEPAAPPSPATYQLPDGASVDVDALGAIRIRDGERTLFATAPSARITARSFTDVVQGITAIYTFSRDDERSFPLGPISSHGKDGAGVFLRYGGDGSHAGGVVTIRADKPGTTVVRVEVEARGDQRRSLAVPLACDERSTFFGFGEQYNAADQRGEAFSLFVSEQGIGRQPDATNRAIAGDAHTTYFPMPYFLDARGFGLLARTAHRTLVDLCKTDPAVAWMEVESGDPLELVIFHGPSPLDVIRELGDEVGRPRLPPAWAFGTWIGAQGGRDAVLARLARAEAANVAAKVVWVQDWTGERRNFDGGSGVQYRWVADEARYPDLPGMIAGLKSRGYRFLSYANPFVVPKLEHYDAMAAGGMLVRREGGAVYDHVAPNGGAATPDFTNPATYDYVGAAFKDMVGRVGMDGFMADFGEWAPVDGVYASGADPRVEHNLFPLRWHAAWRRTLDELRPDGDYVVFARSGFTGVHRFAQIYWVGDQEADFSPSDGLPTVIPAMLTLGISGVPFVTHDVAGFSGGPSTKELTMRWTELGAFSPILRTHDGNKRDANWAWDKDEETTTHFARMSRVHERLGAELRSLAEEAARTGAPMVRHLVLVYPADRESARTHDEYLLGDRLLVAPVVTAGAQSRRVYFPPGSGWFNVWTGVRFEGGTSVEVDAPIGSPPVFARDEDRADLRAP